MTKQIKRVVKRGLHGDIISIKEYDRDGKISYKKSKNGKDEKWYKYHSNGVLGYKRVKSKDMYDETYEYNMLGELSHYSNNNTGYTKTCHPGIRGKIINDFWIFDLWAFNMGDFPLIKTQDKDADCNIVNIWTRGHITYKFNEFGDTLYSINKKHVTEHFYKYNSEFTMIEDKCVIDGKVNSIIRWNDDGKRISTIYNSREIENHRAYNSNGDLVSNITIKNNIMQKEYNSNYGTPCTRDIEYYEETSYNKDLEEEIDHSEYNAIEDKIAKEINKKREAEYIHHDQMIMAKVLKDERRRKGEAGHPGAYNIKFKSDVKAYTSPDHMMYDVLKDMKEICSIPLEDILRPFDNNAMCKIREDYLNSISNINDEDNIDDVRSNMKSEAEAFNTKINSGELELKNGIVDNTNITKEILRKIYVITKNLKYIIIYFKDGTSVACNGNVHQLAEWYTFKVAPIVKNSNDMIGTQCIIKSDENDIITRDDYSGDITIGNTLYDCYSFDGIYNICEAFKDKYVSKDINIAETKVETDKDVHECAKYTGFKDATHIVSLDDSYEVDGYNRIVYFANGNYLYVKGVSSEIDNWFNESVAPHITHNTPHYLIRVVDKVITVDTYTKGKNVGKHLLDCYDLRGPLKITELFRDIPEHNNNNNMNGGK